MPCSCWPGRYMGGYPKHAVLRLKGEGKEVKAALSSKHSDLKDTMAVLKPRQMGVFISYLSPSFEHPLSSPQSLY